jgi:hypothetical protein
MIDMLNVDAGSILFERYALQVGYFQTYQAELVLLTQFLGSVPPHH